MVAMLVKLLLFLYASNTSPASSLAVSFSRSEYALCCNLFSFNILTFLFPLLSRAIAEVSQCEMDSSFLGLLGLFSAYLRLSEVPGGAILRILPDDKYDRSLTLMDAGDLVIAIYSFKAKGNLLQFTKCREQHQKHEY